MKRLEPYQGWIVLQLQRSADSQGLDNQAAAEVACVASMGIAARSGNGTQCQSSAGMMAGLPCLGPIAWLPGRMRIPPRPACHPLLLLPLLQIDLVLVPAVTGDFGVMPGHVPTVAQLRCAWNGSDGGQEVGA